jgi:hypothetical protein
MTLHHAIFMHMDASAVHMHSVSDTEKGELKVSLLLFVPNITHAAYAKRILFEFMEPYHATSNIWDVSIKHMHIVLDIEKDKLAELIHSLVPTTHVAYVKKTSLKMMTPYHV